MRARTSTTRQARLARLVLAVALAVGGGAVGAPPAAAAAAAAAALPLANATVEVHDHAAAGRNWHVQAEISSTGLSIRMLVLYVQECRQTVFVRGVGVSPTDGSFSVARPIAARAGRPGGSWRMTGTFTEPTHLLGSYALTVGGCTTGARPFHAHVGGGHSHQSAGTPLGRYPDLAAAPAARRDEALALWQRTLASARTARFASVRRARRAGFRGGRGRWQRPLTFHLRQPTYERDGRTLDPRRPESLVYWWPADADPLLIAFMYRAPARRPVALGAPLLGWHSHSSADGRVGRSQMTHVWLTGDLRSGLANCMPVPALEAALPAFRYAMARHGSGVESHPCPAP